MVKCRVEGCPEQGDDDFYLMGQKFSCLCGFHFAILFERAINKLESKIQVLESAEFGEDWLD